MTWTNAQRVNSEFRASKRRKNEQAPKFEVADFIERVAEFTESGFAPQQLVDFVEDFAVDLDRKFADSDLDADDDQLLHTVAVWWLTTGSGANNTFEFLVQQREAWNRWGGLSTGQLRGVLNCIRADVLRRGDSQSFGEFFPKIVEALHKAKAHAQAKMDEKPARGRATYAHATASIQIPVGSSVIRLSIAGKQSRYTGDIHIAEKPDYDLYDNNDGPQGEYFGRLIQGTGEANERLMQHGEIILILRDLETDPSTKIREYSRLMGRCAVCGRTLTNEKSIERGIGPVCAENMGW